MSEMSCHFKTKFMKIDNSDFGISYLNVILLKVFLPKKGTYAHSKFNQVSS